MKITMGHHLLFPFRLRNALSAKLFRLMFSHRFAAFGQGANLVNLDGVEGAGNISIGAGAVVGSHGFLAARPLQDGQIVSLIIGRDARIGRNNHIYATHRIEIGPRVLTAGNVYISDNSHAYENPHIPVFDQPLIQLPPVEIGAGSWIGQGASVIGARIGRNCVIGAGALVRNDIPDYCVAVGVPARIVKRFDRDRGTWRLTRPDGSFFDFDR